MGEIGGGNAAQLGNVGGGGRAQRRQHAARHRRQVGKATARHGQRGFHELVALLQQCGLGHRVHGIDAPEQIPHRLPGAPLFQLGQQRSGLVDRGDFQRGDFGGGKPERALVPRRQAGGEAALAMVEDDAHRASRASFTASAMM
ncbi:hypothetical protein D3C72_1977560 [compost metagenome]